MCAYARKEAATVKAKKQTTKVVLTAEEKAEKKALAAARKVVREKKKTWEEGLREWQSPDGDRLTFPMGTKVCVTRSRGMNFPHSYRRSSSRATRRSLLA